MIQKIKNKIKNFFSPLFDEEKKEKGAAVTLKGILIGAAIVSAVAGGGALYAATQWDNFLGEIGRDVIAGLIGFLLRFGQGFFNTASDFFFHVTASDFVTQTITGSEAFEVGYEVTRNFANMFVVLGFVVVGLATILKLREYEAQKTLVPLIIVAVLVNFAPLLCGLVIDGTNIATNYFLSAGQAGGVAQSIGISLDGAHSDLDEEYELEKDETGENFNNYAISAVVLAIMYTISGITFALLAVLFAARVALLTFFSVLAPIAFVAYPFSKTKGIIFDKWLQGFLSWAFVGAISGFLIYLSAITLAETEGDDITNLLIPLVYLIIAYKLARKTQAPGAAAVIGGATAGVAIAKGATVGAGKKVAGASKKVAGGAAEKTGVKRKMEEARDKSTEKREGTVVGPKMGTVEKRKRKRMSKAHEEVDNLSTEKQAEIVNKRQPKSGEARREQIAAFQNLAKEGELGEVSQAQKERLYKETQQNNPQAVGTIEKADPTLARLNNKKVEKIKNERGVETPEAEKIAVQERTRSLSQENVRNLSPDTIKKEEIGSNLSASQIKGLRKGSPKQVEALSSHTDQLGEKYRKKVREIDEKLGEEGNYTGLDDYEEKRGKALRENEEIQELENRLDEIDKLKSANYIDEE